MTISTTVAPAATPQTNSNDSLDQDKLTKCRSTSPLNRKFSETAISTIQGLGFIESGSSRSLAPAYEAQSIDRQVEHLKGAFNAEIGIREQTSLSGEELVSDKYAELNDKLQKMSNRDKQALLSRVHKINNLRLSFSRTKLTALAAFRLLACLGTLPISGSVSLAITLSKDPEAKVRKLRKQTEEFRKYRQPSKQLEDQLKSALRWQKVAAFFVRNLSFHGVLRTMLMRQFASLIIREYDEQFFREFGQFRENALVIIRVEVFNAILESFKSKPQHEKLKAFFDIIKNLITESSSSKINLLDNSDEIINKVNSKSQTIRSLISVEEINDFIEKISNIIEETSEREERALKELNTANEALSNQELSDEKKSVEEHRKTSASLELSKICQSRIDFTEQLLDNLTRKLLKEKNLKQLVKQIVDQSPPLGKSPSNYTPLKNDSMSEKNKVEDHLLPITHLKKIQEKIEKPFTRVSIKENAKNFLSDIFSRTRASLKQ